MRLLNKLVLLASMVGSHAAMSANACVSDQALHDADFKIHASSNFDRLASEAMARYIFGGNDFVFETAGPIRSRNGQRRHETLILYSYDDVTTPRSTQYGDLVFVFVHEPTGDWEFADPQKASIKGPMARLAESRPVEVRWWANGERHVAYDKDRIRCAAHSVPLAVNSLF
jgi:hypothetical protein